MPVDTVTVYAISDSQPPVIWFSEWSVVNGERISGGDIPDGFRRVDQVEYEQAALAQRMAVVRANESAHLARRRSLAAQRSGLIVSGMSEKQARLLVPDPDLDYTIDDEFR